MTDWKRVENQFAQDLREFFPDICSNRGEQANKGGCDLVNAGNFNIEVKAGKSYSSKWLLDALKQIRREGDKDKLDLLLVSSGKRYVVIPFKDFITLLRAI